MNKEIKQELIADIRSRVMERTESLLENMNSETRSDDDILGFIKTSKLSKTGEDNIISIEQKRAKPPAFYKTLLYAAGIFMVFGITLFFNFFHHLMQPQENFIQLASTSSLQITREGYLFGQMDIETDKILVNYDNIEILKDSILKTGRAFDIYAKQNSRFKLNENNNQFSAVLNEGSFFLNFFKAHEKKRIIELPLDSRIIVTGTKIFVRAKESGYEIFMQQGNATLVIDESEKHTLTRGYKYTLHKDGNLQKKALSSKAAKMMTSPFENMPGFFIKNRSGPGIPENNRKEVNPLLEIEKKYGKLLVVKTKDEQEYIGSYVKGGKDLTIMTTKGKITIKSNNIKSVKKYR